MSKYQFRRITLLWSPIMLTGLVLNALSMRLTTTMNGLTLLAMGIFLVGALLIVREAK